MADRHSRIEIYDTTLRDGTQGLGVSLSVQDKLLIAQRLDDLGVDYIEGGYPLSNPKDVAFFREIAAMKFRHARIVAFGMTRRKGSKARADDGMKALLSADTEVVTIVGKSWDLHVHEVLGVSEEENLAMIADSAGTASPPDGRSFTTPSTSSTAQRRTPNSPCARSWLPRKPAPRASVSATRTAARCPSRSPNAWRPCNGTYPHRSASTRTTTAAWPSPTLGGRTLRPMQCKNDERHPGTMRNVTTQPSSATWLKYDHRVLPTAVTNSPR